MEAQTIRKYSTWFTIYGIALIVLGALAILAPDIATLATSILVGWLLLASGILRTDLGGRRPALAQPGFWWNSADGRLSTRSPARRCCGIRSPPW